MCGVAWKKEQGKEREGNSSDRARRSERNDSRTVDRSKALTIRIESEGRSSLPTGSGRDQSIRDRFMIPESTPHQLRNSSSREAEAESTGEWQQSTCHHPHGQDKVSGCFLGLIFWRKGHFLGWTEVQAGKQSGWGSPSARIAVPVVWKRETKGRGTKFGKYPV
ncbi:unnamed protein product [Caretta caretta]